MKKSLIFSALITVILSCEENKPADNVVSKSTDETTQGTVESMAKRHIESKLSIPATEKYSYHIYKEHLDGDDKIDAIITVNRLEYALNEAAKSANTAKQAEIGFMGNYNYIFFYDGGLNQISPQIAIPSSPKAELKISFENLQSGAFKDLVIDFRIMNASYKEYYTVNNHIPRRVFQWKNYDGLKSSETEAFYFEYSEGTMGPIKDILVKKAILIQPKEEVDIYSYEPELKKTDELVYRFFYHPKEGKYMTLKK